MIKKDEVGGLVGYITHPEDLDSLYTFLYEEFDISAEEYSKQYVNLQKQLKQLKKYLVIKLACYPLEIALSFLLMGKLEAKIKHRQAKKVYRALKAKHLDAEEMAKVYDLC